MADPTVAQDREAKLARLQELEARRAAKLARLQELEQKLGKKAEGQEAPSRVPQTLEEAVSRSSTDNMSPEARRALMSPLTSLEIGTALASGAVAEPAAGLTGAVRGLYGLATGESKDEALANAASAVEGTRDTLTYSPRGETAQAILNTAGKALAPIEKALDIGGEKIAEATGSPLIGALTKAGIELFPFGRAVPKSFLKAREAGKAKADSLKTLKQDAISAGVNLDAPLEQQKKQIAAAAVRDTQGRFAIGQDLPKLQEAVIKAKRETKNTAAALFDEARAKKAAFPVKSLETFLPSVDRALSDYRVDLMPTLGAGLSELRSIYSDAVKNKKRVTYWTTADYNKLENVRRRISAMAPPIDTPEGAASSVVVGMIDKFADDLLDSDLMSGDPTAIPVRKQARAAWRDYLTRFKEEDVIKKLVKDHRATPEQMKDWIFGASAVGAKPEAGRVIRSLKDSLTIKDPKTGEITVNGGDSPQFKALRHEVLLDVMKPLLNEDVSRNNLAQFRVNYERLIRDNKTIVDELFDEPELKRLDDLAKYSYALSKQSPDMLAQLDIGDAVVRSLFGHEIAQGAVKVGIARRMWQSMVNLTGKERRKLIADIGGYDAKASDGAMSSYYAPVNYQAILQSRLEQAQLQEEQDRLEEEQRKQEAFTKRPPPVQTRGTLSPGQGAGPQPPAGGAPPGGPPNTQSRAMLQSLFPNDSTLQMPPPQPPMPA